MSLGRAVLAAALYALAIGAGRAIAYWTSPRTQSFGDYMLHPPKAKR